MTSSIISRVDIRTFNTLITLNGHTTDVTVGRWIPSSPSLIVSGDYGGNLLFWDIQYVINTILVVIVDAIDAWNDYLLI